MYEVTSGIAQGSVMGPYLFAAYMGALASKCEDIKIVLYADDITVIETMTENAIPSVGRVKQIVKSMGFEINESKSFQLCFKRSQNHQCLNFESTSSTDNVKVLGLIINNRLTWYDQIISIIRKSSQRLYVIRVLKKIMNVSELKQIYHSLITSLFLYASPVYGRLSVTNMYKLERFQRRAHRTICGADCGCSDFVRVETRLNNASLKYLSKCERSVHPLHDVVPLRLARSGHFCLPHCNTERRARSFIPYACRLFNESISSFIH